MFEKRKLASAIAVAIGTTVIATQAVEAGGGGPGGSKASAMFPTVVASDSVTTVISVINDGRGLEDVNGKELLHYTYWFKGLEAGETLKDFNEKACLERNRYLPTSKYDIQTFDVSGRFFGTDAGDKGIMFDDPSVNNQWDNTSQDWQFGKTPATHRAVLFVDNYKTAGQRYRRGHGPISGEAVVFEIVTGASWGYRALERIGREGNCDNDTGSSQEIDGCIRNSADLEDYLGNYSAYASADQSQVPFMPPAEVTTIFLTTPVAVGPHGGGHKVMKKGVVYPEPDQLVSQGKLEAYIGVRGLDEVTAGVFGRDEEFLSGGIDRKVVCVGGWTLPDLYPDAIDPPNEVPGGGWTHITNYTTLNVKNADGVVTGTTRYDPAAIVYKVEYGDVADLDDGALPNGDGIFNNGLYLHPEYYRYVKPRAVEQE